MLIRIVAKEGHSLYSLCVDIFDVFDKPFDVFDKPFDVCDKSFDAFDKGRS